jgi:hypothetical protein
MGDIQNCKKTFSHSIIPEDRRTIPIKAFTAAPKVLPLTMKNVKTLQDQLAEVEGEDFEVECRDGESENSEINEEESDGSSHKLITTGSSESSIVTESAASDVDWDFSVQKASPQILRNLKRERKVQKQAQKRRNLRRKKGLPSNSSSDPGNEFEVKDETEENEESDGPLQHLRKRSAKAKADLLARLFLTGGS